MMLLLSVGTVFAADRAKAGMELGGQPAKVDAPASEVSMLVSTQIETDAGYDLALGELRTVLEEKGYRATTRYLDKGDPLPDGNKILVGELGQEIVTGQSS